MKWNVTKPIKYLLFLFAFVLILLVVLVLLYFRFGGDFGVNLPGGYSLNSIYGGAVEIWDRGNNAVVCPNIEKYKVYEQKHLVVGHVSNEGLLPREAECSVPGYFILDTQSGKVTQGVEESAWLDSLKEYGITEKPRLHVPTGFDRNYK